MTSRMSSGSSRADSAVEPDEIAEHHRQLPAFGAALYRCTRARRPDGGRSRGGGHCGTKRGDSVEQPPAMPDQGDTEILQILGRQAREHFFVDLVIAERLVVTLKTKAAQPYRYVHAVILGSEERQPLMDDDSSK